MRYYGSSQQQNLRLEYTCNNNSGLLLLPHPYSFVHEDGAGVGVLKCATVGLLMKSVSNVWRGSDLVGNKNLTLCPVKRGDDITIMTPFDYKNALPSSALNGKDSGSSSDTTWHSNLIGWLEWTNAVFWQLRWRPATTIITFLPPWVSGSLKCSSVVAIARIILSLIILLHLIFQLLSIHFIKDLLIKHGECVRLLFYSSLELFEFFVADCLTASSIWLMILVTVLPCSSCYCCSIGDCILSVSCIAVILKPVSNYVWW